MSSFLVPLKKNYVLVLKLNFCMLSIYQAGAVFLSQSRCCESVAGMAPFLLLHTLSPLPTGGFGRG